MNQTTESLSQRGSKLAENPSRSDIDIFFEATENLYHPDENPDGAFPLSVAENVVMAPVIREKLEEIMKRGNMPDWVMQYTSPLGHPEVRDIMAGFMNEFFQCSGIDAENIVLSAGACASLEVTSFALANPGDVVVIPAPAYPMYTGDLGMKSGMERYDLQTHVEIAGKKSLALVTINHLEEALREIEAEGKVFKMLLLTTPDNPTGSKHTASQLTTIADWCLKKRIHLLVNEIYAHSLINTDAAAIKDEYPQDKQYVSFATLMEKKKSEYLHLTYALSKDFAMSGLRVGITHSYNEGFIKSLESINIPHMVSNVMQWLMRSLFADHDFISTYLKISQENITKSYLLVINALKSLNIPYAPAMGSLFVWADFSAFLTDDTAKAEHQLWLNIYEQTGLLFTPGEGFQHQKKGLFRIVHTAVPLEHLKVATERLQHSDLFRLKEK